MSEGFTYTAVLDLQDNAGPKLANDVELAKQLKAQLQSLTAGAFGNIGGQAAGAGSSVASLAGAVSGLTAQFGQLAGITGAGLGLAKLGSEVRQLGADFVDLFGEVMKIGVAFDAQIETGRIGIAATISTFNTFTDATGHALSGQEKFTAAMQVAGEAQERLRAAAFQTTATFSQLEGGFEQITAAAGKQKSTIEENVRLTTTISNAAVALHIPYEVAFRQISLALEGVTRTTGRMGAFLKAVGADNLKSWNEQGIAVEMLQKKLEEFARIGPMVNQTFTGAMSNMQDAIEQLAGVAARPVMETLKRQLQDVVAEIVHIKEGKVSFDPELESGLRNIGDAAAAAVDDLARFARELAPFMLSVTEGAADTAAGLTSIARGIEEVAKKAATGGGLGGFIARGIAGAAAQESGTSSAATSAATLLNYLTQIGEKAARTESDLTRTRTALQELMSSERLYWDPANWQTGLPSDRWRQLHGMLETLKHDASTLPEVMRLLSELQVKNPSKPDMIPFDFGPISEGLSDKQLKAIATWKERLLDTANDIAERVAALDPLGKGFGVSAEKAQGQIQKLGESIKEHLKDSPKDVKLLSFEVEVLRGSLAGLREEQDAGRGGGILGLAFGTQNDQIAAYGEALTGTGELATKVLDDIAKAEAKLTSSFVDDIRVQHDADLDRWRQRLRAAGLGLDAIASLESSFAAQDKLYAATLAAALSGDVAETFRNLGGLAEETGKPIGKLAGQFAQELGPKAETASQGVVLGLLEIEAQAKSTGVIVADLVTGLHDAFEHGLGALLDGASKGLDGIKDALTSWADQVYKLVSGTFSKLLAKWIDTRNQVRLPDGTSYGGDASGNWSSPTHGASPFGGMDLSSGIVFGAGLLNGLAPGVGTFDYVALGASVGMMFKNVWATIIGAVVGLIAGILAPSKGEVKEQFTQAALTPGFVPPGYDAQALYPQQEMFSRAVDTMEAGLLDAARTAGGTGGAREFSTAMQRIIKQYLSGVDFTVHAGAQSDFSADVAALLTGKIPADMLHSLFGSNGYAPGSGLQGVIGGTHFNAESFDPNAPIPKMLAGLGFTAAKIREVSLLIDVKGPEKFVAFLQDIIGIVAGFRDLGATLGQTAAERFAGFAAADSASPADYFTKSAANLVQLGKEISNYTGDEKIAKAKELLQLGQQYQQQQETALRRIYDLQRQLGSSIDAQIADMQHAMETPGEREARLSNVVSLSGSRIANATTPEQIQQITVEAQNAIKELFDHIQEQITQTKQLISDFNDLAGKFHALGLGNLPGQHANSIEDFWRGKVDFTNKRNDANALTGDAKIEAQRALYEQGTKFYEDMLSFIERARDAAAQIPQDIARITADWATALMSPDERMAHDRGILAGTSALIQGATTPEQVTAALSAAENAAQDLFSALKSNLDEARATLQRIGEDMRQLHDSIAGQIEDMQTSLMNPQQKDAYYDSRIKELMIALRSASTEDEVKRLTGQIQNYARLDYGLFGADDPQRQAAAAGLTGILNEAETLANAAYGRIATTTQNTVTTLETEMATLTTTMRTLGTEGVDKLNALADAAQALAEQFGTEVGGASFDATQGLRDLYTAAHELDFELRTLKSTSHDALGSIAGDIVGASAPLLGDDGTLARVSRGFTTVETSIGDQNSGAVRAFNRVTDAANRAADRLEALAGTEGGGAAAPPSGSSAASVYAFAARNPRVLRVGTGR